MGEVTGPQLLRGVDHASYHQDLFEGPPRFSRSIAVRLLQQSPLHAHAAHPRLGGQAVEELEEDEDAVPGEAPKPWVERGGLLHGLLLGHGADIVEVYIHGDKKKGEDPALLYPAPSFATKESREIRDAARAAGKLPVIPAKLAAAKVSAMAIRASLARYGIHLEAYEPEATALWDSEGVASKARTDLLLLARGELLDFKVVDRINIRAFEAGVERYGLDIQASAYVEAVEACHPPLAGRVSLEFVLVERLPPYDVAVVPLSPALVDLGGQKWRRARGIWRQCLESGVWPGFGRQEPIQPKPWQLEAELAHMAAGSEAAFDRIAP